MARIKNPITVDETGSEIAPAAAEAILRQQNDAAERLAVVVAQYGDGLPFDAHRYEYIIRDHLARSAESMLAAGRALIVAKEHLPHGEFTSFIIRIGLEYTVATRMMQAAIKFSGGNTPKLVEAAGNKTKLFELLVLDDEEIQELADGGTVAGLTLDEIERASTSRLRALVRDAQEEKKAADKLLADKNTRIDTLQAELEKQRRRVASATPDEVIADLRREFSAHVHGVESAIRTSVEDAIRQLQDIAGAEPGTDRFVASGVQQIRAALDSMCAELGVTAATPEWAGSEA